MSLRYPSLEKYGHVVRTIVYDATVGDMPWHASIDERPRLIGRCFCLMLHANDLKVIGHHILFMPRHSRTYGLTQHASFPRNTVLAPPFDFGPDADLVSRLALPEYMDNDKQLEEALRLLGTSLRQIHVEGWVATPSDTPRHFTPLPHLSSLTVVGRELKLRELSHLLRRTEDSTGTTSLRRLIMLRVQSFKPKHLRRLLRQHKLGSRLDALSISFRTTTTRWPWLIPICMLSECMVFKELKLDAVDRHISRLGALWDRSFIFQPAKDFETLKLCMVSYGARDLVDIHKFRAIVPYVYTRQIRCLRNIKFAVWVLKRSSGMSSGFQDFLVEGVPWLKRECEAAGVQLDVRFREFSLYSDAVRPLAFSSISAS